MKCSSFFKNFNQYLKNVYQKTLSFLELLYKKKEKIPIDFLIGELDVDSYFFYIFLDVYVVQNRVLRLSKGMFRETYSIKDFTFDPHIGYQRFELTAELYLTGKKILFILESLQLKKIVRYYIRDSFYPLPNTQICKEFPAKFFILHFLKDFQISKSFLSRFGIRFREICFEKLNHFELSSHIYIKTKELDYLLKNQQFLTDNIQKIQSTS